MKIRKILIFPAIDDEPIPRQLILRHQALSHRQRLRQKSGIGCRVHLRQRSQVLPGEEQNVKGVRRLGMPKSEQGLGLAQKTNREGKRQVTHNPTKGKAKQAFRQR